MGAIKTIYTDLLKTELSKKKAKKIYQSGEHLETVIFTRNPPFADCVASFKIKWKGGKK